MAQRSNGKGREILGIGYEKGAVFSEIDTNIRSRISAELDRLTGLMEWLKTDQSRKGGDGWIGAIDGLSARMEKISRKIEPDSPSDSVSLKDVGASDQILKTFYETEKDMLELLREVDLAVQGITETNAFPDTGRTESLERLLDNLDRTVNDRLALLKRFGDS